MIDREIDKLDFAGRMPKELYLPVDYVMSNGGKRLRPVLSLLACGMFSDNLKPALMPAIAIEVFHNFTLLHDDIMDKADIRRSKPTVHKKWNENTAILSGDAMVVLSFDFISSAEKEILPALLSIFNRTAIEVCEGQQMDMNFETMTEVSEEMYIEMITRKTSALIAAALKIGAVCGGAGERDASLMYESGLNLGIAFQIQDDLLDLYGEQEEFGKKPGGDILLNKKTFLLVAALERAKGETAIRLKYLMEKENDPEIRLTGVKKIFDDLSIRSITENKSERYFNRAIDKLNATSPGNSMKTQLNGFIKTIMKRNS
jgi:geranylgeranyl diphosphate synthase, type II